MLAVIISTSFSQQTDKGYLSHHSIPTEHCGAGSVNTLSTIKRYFFKDNKGNNVIPAPLAILCLNISRLFAW